MTMYYVLTLLNSATMPADDFVVDFADDFADGYFVDCGYSADGFVDDFAVAVVGDAAQHRLSGLLHFLCRPPCETKKRKLKTINRY